MRRILFWRIGQKSLFSFKNKYKKSTLRKQGAFWQRGCWLVQCVHSKAYCTKRDQHPLFFVQKTTRGKEKTNDKAFHENDIFLRPDRSYVLWKACRDGRCGWAVPLPAASVYPVAFIGDSGTGSDQGEEKGKNPLWPVDSQLQWWEQTILPRSKPGSHDLLLRQWVWRV